VPPPERTTSAKMPAVTEPQPAGDGGFGRPITDPGAQYAPPQQQYVPPPQFVPPPQVVMPPPQPLTGIVIPQWVLQIVPLAILLVSASLVFATQRADVDQIKQNLLEMRSAHDVDKRTFVTQQVFDLKLGELERIQGQINARLERIEALISGIYDRLPSKHEK
jgi:hypothetical protein